MIYGVAETSNTPGGSQLLTLTERYVRILKNSARFAGTFTTLQWCWLRLWQKLNSGVRTASLRPRQVCHPLTVHLGGTSDMMVFEQIFISEEYACLKDLKDVRFILDLGANVGFFQRTSSAFFQNPAQLQWNQTGETLRFVNTISRRIRTGHSCCTGQSGGNVPDCVCLEKFSGMVSTGADRCGNRPGTTRRTSTRGT